MKNLFMKGRFKLPINRFYVNLSKGMNQQANFSSLSIEIYSPIQNQMKDSSYCNINFDAMIPAFKFFSSKLKNILLNLRFNSNTLIEEEAILACSTKRKRKAKMNKHKLKKRRKKMRMNTKLSRG